MGIKEFKISGIVYDTAHKVACLLIMEEREIQSLHLVIDFLSDIPDQIPCSPVSHIVAEKAEHDPEQIKKKYLQSEYPYGSEILLLNPPADDPGQSRKNSG